jgi:hypothetical protein
VSINISNNACCSFWTMGSKGIPRSMFDFWNRWRLSMFRRLNVSKYWPFSPCLWSNGWKLTNSAVTLSLLGNKYLFLSLRHSGTKKCYNLKMIGIIICVCICICAIYICMCIYNCKCNCNFKWKSQNVWKLIFLRIHKCFPQCFFSLFWRGGFKMVLLDNKQQTACTL